MLFVRLSVLDHFSKLAKQNNVRCWRYCESGWVDHWCHLFCLVCMITYSKFLLYLIYHEWDLKQRLQLRGVQFWKRLTGFLTEWSSDQEWRFFFNDPRVFPEDWSRLNYSFVSFPLFYCRPQFLFWQKKIFFWNNSNEKYLWNFDSCQMKNCKRLYCRSASHIDPPGPGWWVVISFISGVRTSCLKTKTITRVAAQKDKNTLQR